MLTRSYLCGGYDSKGIAICPTRWSVREDLLWQTILGVIEDHYGRLLRSPSFVEAVRKRAKEIMKRPSPRSPSISDLQQERARIDRNVRDLVANVRPENLPMLENVLTELRSRKKEIESLIAERQQAAPVGKALSTSSVNAVGEELRASLELINDASPSLKRRFVRQLVERIELDPGKKTGTAWLWRLPKSVLDSLGMSVSRIAGARYASHRHASDCERTLIRQSIRAVFWL